MKCFLRSGWPGAALCLLLGGCFSSSPPATFYTLSASPADAIALPAVMAPQTTIALGPVELADYLDRSEIVTRGSANRLQISATDRWGGSLRNNVEQVLRDHLAALLASAGYRVVAWESPVAVAYRLQLDIARFEQDADATVVLVADWLVLETGKEGVAASGSARVHEPIAGNGRDATVAAMSRALATLGRELAEKLREALPQR